MYCFFLKLGELIPIPADSPPPPALSSNNVSSFPALRLAQHLLSPRWYPAPSSPNSGQPALLGSVSGGSPGMTRCPQNVLTTERREIWTQRLEICFHVVAESSWARGFPSLGLSLFICDIMIGISDLKEPFNI